MNKIKIPKQEMLDILWGVKSAKGKIIEDTISENTRWSIIHDIVFSYDGKFYSAYYSVGATESQDESAWDNDKEVEATEVHQIEKTIKVWEPIK